MADRKKFRKTEDRYVTLLSTVFCLLFSSFLLSSPAQLSSPTITLEHAWTTEQINWGLMQRQSLPKNHGMLFHYRSDATPSFWAFNCFIDLSVAYIDRNRIIRQIKDLYAHPEIMDPARPVNNLADMAKYGRQDPIIDYFIKNGVSCETPCRYVLEMNLGWFEANGVKIGDAISWDLQSQTAVFQKENSRQ